MNRNHYYIDAETKHSIGQPMNGWSSSQQINEVSGLVNPSRQLVGSDPRLLATRLHELNHRQTGQTLLAAAQQSARIVPTLYGSDHSHDPRRDNRLQQNLVHMKQHIAALNVASTSQSYQSSLPSTTNESSGQHRGYDNIKNDLLQLHRRQSMTQISGGISSSRMNIHHGTSMPIDHRNNTTLGLNLNANATYNVGQTNISLVQFMRNAGQEEYDPRQDMIQSNATYNVDQINSSLAQFTGNAAAQEYDAAQQGMIKSGNGTYRLKGQSHKYAKDYIKLAKEYKRMEPYRCNNPIQQNPCVVCQTVVFKSNSSSSTKSGGGKSKRTIAGHLSKVFFPCEHICVCDACYKDSGPWHTCPLCNHKIKVVFDHTGRETEEYWKWVNEIKPSLASDFRLSFPRQSQKAIAKAMARSIEDTKDYLDEKSLEGDYFEEDELDTDGALNSKTCIVS